MEIVFDSYAVVRIAGSDPEQFLIVFQCTDPEEERPVTKMSERFSETVLRIQLAEMGLTQVRIEQLIQQARERPQ